MPSCKRCYKENISDFHTCSPAVNHFDQSDPLYAIKAIEWISRNQNELIIFANNLIDEGRMLEVSSFEYSQFSDRIGLYFRFVDSDDSVKELHVTAHPIINGLIDKQYLKIIKRKL